MAPKFGTSGLRGLVTELTPDLVRDHTRAFLATCDTGGTVLVGQDLRPSSPDIADWVMQTVTACGLRALDCGALPTPALALHALGAGHAAIMVTGSHIPADRNGLKFYTPAGEILKTDETRILAALAAPAAPAPPAMPAMPAAPAAAPRSRADAQAGYARRYIDAYGPDALGGLRIGLYQHSSVARDVMASVIAALGATVIALARSDTFVPVDTEALDTGTRQMLARWCKEHALDAVISTDGDADRPMVADARGLIVPGDILGTLTAQALGATTICTPVSSNSMVTAIPAFHTVTLTRIGSPYVVAAMQAALQSDPAARVAGYEANGGFLLGFHAQGPAGPLAPLMTRDALLPILAPLATARTRACSLADLVADLPPVFTAADRLAEIPGTLSGALLARLTASADRRAQLFAGLGPETGCDLTDGLRVRFASGEILHLRASGNAPEFRCYAEAATPERAADLVALALNRVRKALPHPDAPA